MIESDRISNKVLKLKTNQLLVTRLNISMIITGPFCEPLYSKRIICNPEKKKIPLLTIDWPFNSIGAKLGSFYTEQGQQNNVESKKDNTMSCEISVALSRNGYRFTKGE